MPVDTVTTTEPENAPPFGVIDGSKTSFVFVNAAVDTAPGVIPVRNEAALMVTVRVCVSTVE